MRKVTHQAFSLLLTGGALTAARKYGYDISPLASVGALAVSSIGCLLPDADTPNSWTGRHLFILCLPLWVFRLGVRIIAKLTHFKPYQRLAEELGHRRLLHYPSTYIILFSLIYMGLRFSVFKDSPFPTWVAVIFVSTLIGVTSHLIGDAIFGGLRLLGPFWDRNIKLSPFNTGSSVETVALLAIVAADLLLIRPALGL